MLPKGEIRELSFSFGEHKTGAGGEFGGALLCTAKGWVLAQTDAAFESCPKKSVRQSQ